MAVMPCPERNCGAQISPQATNCPQCGFPLQQFFDSSLESDITGVPIWPLDYWHQWHFWYWWGCGSSNIEFSKASWVKIGDPLMRIGTITVPSPVEGLMVSNNEYNRRESVQVSKLWTSHSFSEIRSLKNCAPTEIGFIYSGILEYIEHYHRKRRKGTITYWYDQTIGLGLDPKKRFKDYDELMEKARDMLNIRAQNLPLIDWK